MEDVGDELQIASHKKLSKQLVRALSPDAPPPPGATRLSAEAASIVTDEYTFHYIVEGGIIFLVLTDKSYTRLLAFSYLTELTKTFFAELRTSTRQGIHAVQRPYSFIRFDSQIQATKKRYINTRHLQSREDLAELSHEVSQYPTYKIADVLGSNATSSAASRFGLAVPPNIASVITSGSPTTLSTMQSRMLVLSACAIFLVDISYLLLQWTSLLGSPESPDPTTPLSNPSVIAKLFVLLTGLASPVLLLVAHRYHRAALNSALVAAPAPPRLADCITAHAILQLLQLIWAATFQSSGKTRGSGATSFAFLLGGSGSMPLPVEAFKATYILVITIA
ncbi:SNAP receptor, partial [Thoreauomyces humboldtii]